MVKILYTKEEQAWNKEMLEKVNEWRLKAEALRKKDGARFYRGIGLLNCLNALGSELLSKTYLTSDVEMNSKSKEILESEL